MRSMCGLMQELTQRLCTPRHVALAEALVPGVSRAVQLSRLNAGDLSGRVVTILLCKPQESQWCAPVSASAGCPSTRKFIGNIGSTKGGTACAFSHPGGLPVALAVHVMPLKIPQPSRAVHVAVVGPPRRLPDVKDSQWATDRCTIEQRGLIQVRGSGVGRGDADKARFEKQSRCPISLLP